MNELAIKCQLQDLSRNQTSGVDLPGKGGVDCHMYTAVCVQMCVETYWRSSTVQRCHGGMSSPSHMHARRTVCATRRAHDESCIRSANGSGSPCDTLSPLELYRSSSVSSSLSMAVKELTCMHPSGTALSVCVHEKRAVEHTGCVHGVAGRLAPASLMVQSKSKPLAKRRNAFKSGGSSQ